MATVVNAPTYRKCFFAHLHGLSGTLAKLDDDRIYFFHQESGDLREVGFPIAITQKIALRRPVCWTHL